MAYPTKLRGLWWVTVLCGVAACGGSAANSPAEVHVSVDAAAAGPAVNRRVLGTNVQWVDGGDDLLMPGTLTFDAKMLDLTQAMGPTVLRYPGGAQSDLYDWTQGVGPLETRGHNRQSGTGREQMTRMGTAELLELARKLHAEALFTVNLVTGTPAEAAAWVRLTNVTGLHNAEGEALPKVTLWELGNEPYLPNPDGTSPKVCEIDALTYAARIDAFAEAMRAVDPEIQLGIALASDRQNGIPVVSPGCRHFTRTVLEGLKERVDFVSVHDAYLPYDISGQDHSAEAEYRAAMASTESLRRDLHELRQELGALPAVTSLPFAITEYSALFSFNPQSAYLHAMASPMAALYIADALRVFASDDSVLLANAWSLSGNDHWGAIRSAADGGDAHGGPAFQVFRLFADALQGRRLLARVRSPTFDAPSLGFSAAAAGLPLVTALATEDAAAVRLVLINKDYTASHAATIAIEHATAKAIHVRTLSAKNVLRDDAAADAMQESDATLATSLPAKLTLPPHSVTLLTVDLERSSP